MIKEKMSSAIKMIVDVIEQGNNIVYIFTMFIAILCILLSFVSTNIRQVETILQGLGCSGIAASMMAFFIDYRQKQKQDKIVLSQPVRLYGVQSAVVGECRPAERQL